MVKGQHLLYPLTVVSAVFLFHELSLDLYCIQIMNAFLCF